MCTIVQGTSRDVGHIGILGKGRDCMMTVAEEDADPTYIWHHRPCRLVTAKGLTT